LKLSKQEVLKIQKIGNFLSHNMENKEVFHPYKTGSFEGNRKFLRLKRQEIFYLSNTGSVQDEKTMD